MYSTPKNKYFFKDGIKTGDREAEQINLTIGSENFRFHWIHLGNAQTNFVCVHFVLGFLVYSTGVHTRGLFLIVAAKSAENRTGDLTYHKVLTYIEYTEQCMASSELLTPHPLSTQRVCPPPGPKAGGGGTHSPGGDGDGGEGSIFRKTPDIGLAFYSIISLRFLR